MLQCARLPFLAATETIWLIVACMEEQTSLGRLMEMHSVVDVTLLSHGFVCCRECAPRTMWGTACVYSLYRISLHAHDAPDT